MDMKEKISIALMALASLTGGTASAQDICKTAADVPLV